MLCFIGLTGPTWGWGALIIIAFISHYWKKLRVVLIPLFILIAYFAIKVSIEMYREAHPPKSKYDDMPIEKLISEVEARDDSVRALPTFSFVEHSLKEDYGLNLMSGGYTQEKSESGDKYEVWGLASVGKDIYIFRTDVENAGEKMAYSRLVFRDNAGNWAKLKMADGSEPDSRQISMSQYLDQIMSRN